MYDKYVPKFIMSYIWYQLLSEGSKSHIHASTNRLKDITRIVKLLSNKWNLWHRANSILQLVSWVVRYWSCNLNETNFKFHEDGRKTTINVNLVDVWYYIGFVRIIVTHPDVIEATPYSIYKITVVHYDSDKPTIILKMHLITNNSSCLFF